MPIVIFYVDEFSEIQEKFLGFVRCNEGLSGEAISRKILEILKNLVLDINMCRGQGYAGAGQSRQFGYFKSKFEKSGHLRNCLA